MYQDLYQELFLILLEKPEKWIVDAHEGGYLYGMCIRILRQQYYGDRTKFKKYFLDAIGVVDIHTIADKLVLYDIEYNINEDLILLTIEDKMANMGWYEKRILQLYTNGGEGIKPLSVRSIHDATGISRHELNKVINKFKDECNTTIDWDCGNS